MKKNGCYIIGAILCLYGLNNILDIIICLILGIYLFMHIKDDEFEFLYFGLLFFEPILVLPFVGGSFYKIYQFLFIIRLLMELKKGKIRISFIYLIPSLFLILTGLLYNSISEEISLVINVFIVSYILSKEKNYNYYQNLLSYIGIIIAFTSIYGFFRGRVLNVSYLSFSRFSTTIRDPNYSALFINIGIFSIIGNNNFKKYEKSLLLAILIISLFMTVSLTGNGLFILSFIIYCYMNKFTRGIKYTLLALVALIVFINAPVSQNSILYGLHTRVLRMEDSSVNEISSGRENITKIYINNFKQLPLKNRLFGGKNTISGQYRDYMVNKYSLVSHNSYVDMLYMIGIIGLTILLLIYINGIYNLIIVYKKGNKIALNYIIIKIILLVFPYTISIFPFRYYIALYLLNIFQKGIINKNSKTLLTEKK